MVVGIELHLDLCCGIYGCYDEDDSLVFCGDMEPSEVAQRDSW